MKEKIIAEERIKAFRKILDGDFPRSPDDATYNFLAQLGAIAEASTVIGELEKHNVDATEWKNVMIELLKL